MELKTMAELKEIELTDDQKEAVKVAIERTHVVDRGLTKHELAGNDVSVMRRKNEDDRAKLIKIKSAWFPNE